MANIVIATPLLSDAATLTTAGTVSGTLPLTNLQTYRPSQVCRWTSLTNVSVIVDLGASYAITTVALLFINGTTEITRRVRLADTQANLTASPAYDSTAEVMADPSRFVDHFTAVTCRWVRIDLADPNNADGFLEAGRLYVDAAWQPDLNVAEGWQFGVEDDSEIARSLDGGQLVTVRGKRRLLRASFQFQTQDELFTEAYALITERGIGKDLLVIRDPAGTTHRLRQTVYGLLAETEAITHQTADLYAWDFTIRELV